MVGWAHSVLVTNRDGSAEPPDSLLIRRFLDGDEGAFRALYQRHTPRLRMVVARMLGERRDETDDVVQEAWLKGCRGIHGFNGNAKFSTWLTTIGVRAVYSRFTPIDERRVALTDALPATGHDEPADGIDLERAIAALPDHQRAVVILHDIEGFTHEEIGRQLGVATGTSKATLSRARAALRRLLNGGLANAR
jgi:RNA polymerase sigma-70 factor (ECF subfamily)